MYGLHSEHQGSGADIPHILGYLTTRTVADDGIFELRKGSAVSTRVFRVSMEGQLQGADGTLAKPTYSFASEKTTGLHYVGANNVALVIAGVNIVDVKATGVTVTGTLTASGGMDGIVGGVTPAAGTFTDLVSTGNTTIGNATGDALTFHPAAWTLTNAVTITGTWANLGAVTTVDINGGTVGGVTLDGTISGTPTWASTQAMSISGVAATATKLATARAINGVDFDGSAAITVTAAAGTLTGTTLNATVVTSSLTAVGTLASGAVPASLVTAGSFGAGDYTVTGKLTFAGTPTLADGTIGLTAVYGLTLRAIEGSSYDFAVLSKSNGSLIFGIEGTVVTIPGDTTITGGRLYVQGTSFASVIDRALQVGNGALTSAVARLTVAGSTTAATGSATHLKVEGTLIAAAHNDVLRGAYIVPAYTPGAYTGLTFCGLEIGNVAGGATNYAFKTGTGAVYLGDALTVVGAASFNGAVTIGDASGDALTFHPAAWTLTNAVTITGTWTNLGAVTTVDINGGTIDGVTIGGATPAAATCTDVTLTGMGKAARQTDESVGGTDTITFTTNWFAITLTSNWTTATIAGMVAGSSYILQVIQDATGSRTIAWPATFKWTAGSAPTLSTAANAIDVLSIAYDGTNHYATLAVKGAA